MASCAHFRDEPQQVSETCRPALVGREGSARERGGPRPSVPLRSSCTSSRSVGSSADLGRPARGSQSSGAGPPDTNEARGERGASPRATHRDPEGFQDSAVGLLELAGAGWPGTERGCRIREIGPRGLESLLPTASRRASDETASPKSRGDPRNRGIHRAGGGLVEGAMGRRTGSTRAGPSRSEETGTPQIDLP